MSRYSCRLWIMIVLFGIEAFQPLAAYTKKTEMVVMRDGIELATDLYQPSLGTSKLPSILVRTPYKRSASMDEWLIFSLVDILQYHLIIQNTRGRFESQGVDSLYFDDGWGRNEDGYDSIEWIAAQPWSNGKIGMFGGSAMGITQYLAAGAAPPHLTCCVAIVAASNLYEDAIFQGGAFRRSLVDGWLKGVDAEYLIPYFKENALYNGAAYDRVNLSTRYDSVNVPILHVGGWHDIFIQGQLNAFEGIRKSGGPIARDNQRLIVGPWVHNIASENAGELSYPEGQALDYISWLIEWYNHWLKDEPNGINQEAPVQYFLMGDGDSEQSAGNVWVQGDDWPPESTPVEYYLHQDGVLSRDKAGDSPSSFVYDPDNPVPTRGGRNLNIKAGALDQREVESRTDVLIFTTPPLTEAVTIAGRVWVNLWASSDGLDTDFTAKLTDVYPDGRSMLVADGIVQARHRNTIHAEELLTPGVVYPFEIDLWSTAIVFEPGHCIRLAISSSNFPRFEANPNTGHPFRADSLKRIAAQTIYHSAHYPSALVLPVQGDVSAVRAANPPAPEYYYLGANYPNPFNQSTQIPVFLTEQAKKDGAEFTVVNLLGQTVWHQPLSNLSSGFHLLTWPGTDQKGQPLPSGVYLARLKSGSHVEVRKMGLNR